MKSIARLFTAALSCLPLGAAVTITGFSALQPSPAPLGTSITLSVTATDANPGPLTFQFSTALAQRPQSILRDFNIGALANGVWTNQPVSWSTIEGEGQYTIQVVAKDFVSGETATANLSYTFTSLVTSGGLTVVPTTNSLVALAAVPPCPVGDWVRVLFNQTSGQGAVTQTSYQPCQAPLSSNFYLGGMYANTTYNVGYEIERFVAGSPEPWLRTATSGTRTVAGPSTATFTTGSIPPGLSVLGTYSPLTLTPQADQSNIFLHSYIPTVAGSEYQISATDRNGAPIWFYASTDNFTLLTRPLAAGYFFLLQSGPSWYENSFPFNQSLRQIDLTGNIVKETNLGVLNQKLAALGDPDLQSCGSVPFPAAAGSGCLVQLSHDCILLPNGDWAFIGSIEKIAPPGTQGDKTGLNFDVVGDAIIVLDTNLNPVWYWDSFQHDGGGTQLDINRAPPAGDVCSLGAAGCPPMVLINSPGVAPVGSDWMHSNSLFYNKADGNFILSVRAQDWVLKINYSYGVGDGTILWRMGLDGDFTFNNIANDPYPWFSHQHDVGVENNGVMTLFDNGNTRIYTYGGNSRGMALDFDETTMQVTPVFVQDIGYFASALGTAQLLDNGDYFFLAGVIPGTVNTYSLEYTPTTGALTGTEVLDLQGDVAIYRCFRMFDLYSPPPT